MRDDVNGGRAVRLRLVPGTPTRLTLLASDGPVPRRARMYRPLRSRACGAQEIGWLLHHLRLSRTVERDTKWLGVDLPGQFDRLVVVETPATTRTTTGMLRRGGLFAVVKAGPPGSGITAEAEMLDHLGSHPIPVVQTPRLLGRREEPDRTYVAQSALAMADPWPPRKELDGVIEVCARLATAGITHGDLAPWNLARTPTGIALFDWEHGSTTLRPGFDLVHYVMQCAILLQTWLPHDCGAVLFADGGAAVRLAKASGMPLDHIGQTFTEYMRNPPHQAASGVTADRFRREALVHYRDH